jgi:hypothetical protein
MRRHCLVFPYFYDSVLTALFCSKNLPCRHIQDRTLPLEIRVHEVTHEKSAEGG